MLNQMANFYKTKGIFDEDRIMCQLPNKFRKALLLSIYKPQLVKCPLFSGMPDAVITTVAMLMKPYLVVKDDDIFMEDEIGDEMFMVQLTLRTARSPSRNTRTRLHMCSGDLEVRHGSRRLTAVCCAPR